MKKDLEKFGYSKDCQKCRAIERGYGTAAKHGSHTESCRMRLEEAMWEDPVRRKAMERVQERLKTGEEKEEERAQVRPTEEQVEIDASGNSEIPVPIFEELEELGVNENTVIESSEMPVSQGEPVRYGPSSSSGHDSHLIASNANSSGLEVEEPEESRSHLREKRLPEHDSSVGKKQRTQRVAFSEPQVREREDEDNLSLEEFAKRRRLMALNESKMDVAEIFSQSRVCKMAKEMGLVSGFSLDINHVDDFTGRKWDLSDRNEVKRAKGLLRKHKPRVLVVSPPCRLFSSLQNLNGGVSDQERAKGIVLLEAAVELCEEQD